MPFKTFRLATLASTKMNLFGITIVISKNGLNLCKNFSMKSISLKLQDPIFQEMEKLLAELETSRNKYINEAIDFYNALQERKLLEKQLRKESAIVAQDSLDILHEFESLEDEW